MAKSFYEIIKTFYKHVFLILGVVVLSVICSFLSVHFSGLELKYSPIAIVGYASGFFIFSGFMSLLFTLITFKNIKFHAYDIYKFWAISIATLTLWIVYG